MKVSLKTRLLAFFSAICPFCAPARRWPNSTFSKKWREKEHNCPACKAYDEVQRLKGKLP